MCINADESEPATFNNRLLDGEGSPPVARGDLDRLLRHQGRDGLPLPAVRVHPGVSASSRRRSPRPAPPGTWARTSTAAGFNLDVWLHRGRRGVHLRRGDRPDREPRRQAGLAADQAAVPGHRGGVPQADGRQQRRDALLRAAHHRARGELVQVDRHAQELRARSSTASRAT